MSRPAPILLTVAGYYGTLAAARNLGREGIPVVVADPRLLAPARWSRFAIERQRCPPVEQPEQFIEWLLEYGRRHPGTVLYPTSDDVAWLISAHRDTLARHYQLYQPPLSALSALLSKKQLFEHGREAGLQAPRSAFPGSEGELEALGEELGYPLLIKPTSQVLLSSHGKGQRVAHASELRARYLAFQLANRYHPWVGERMPDAAQPMLQEFRPEAAQGIYSVAGFTDASGELFVAAGARKVLQRPRQLGIGLCFEEAPLKGEIASALAALCRRVGYYGVFEAELIETPAGHLLIDFNPRFYSQMAFEVQRGLPLPLLAYLAATGQTEALRARVAQARADLGPQDRVYCHRLIFEVLTRTQRLSGRMSAEETRGWHRWLRAHRGRVADAVADGGDWLPAVVDWAGTLYGYTRHPRSFLRSIVLDR